MRPDLRRGIGLPMLAVLGVSALSLVGLGMSSRHPASALLPALVGLAPMLLWYCAAFLTGKRWAVATLFILLMLGLSLNLAILGQPAPTPLEPQPAAGSIGRLPQQILKMLLLLAAFCVGAVHLPLVRRMLDTSTGLLMLGYCAWAWLTVPFSGSPLLSAASSFGLLAQILFMAAIAARFEEREIVAMLVVAFSLIIAVNWVVYLFLPEVGRSLNAGAVRFVGLYGTPNGAGQMAGSALIAGAACFFVRRERGPMPRWVVRLAIVLIALAGPMLVLTISRGSMAALAVVAGMPLLRRLRLTGFAVALAVLAAAAISQVPLEAYSDVLTTFSRGGQVGEVLSLTGRTEIWSQVLHYIGESPVFGYGYGYGQTFLRDHLILPWGATTDSAHNTLLHSMIDMGLGTVFIVALLGVQVVRFFRRPLFIRDAIFLFIFVVSLVEAGIASTTNPLLPLWLLSLFYGEAAQRAPASAAPRASPPGEGWRAGRAAAGRNPRPASF